MKTVLYFAQSLGARVCVVQNQNTTDPKEIALCTFRSSIPNISRQDKLHCICVHAARCVSRKAWPIANQTQFIHYACELCTLYHNVYDEH